VKASKVFSTPLMNANAAVMFSASNLMSPVGPLHRISTSHLVPTLTIDPMAQVVAGDKSVVDDPTHG